MYPKVVKKVKKNTKFRQPACPPQTPLLSTSHYRASLPGRALGYASAFWFDNMRVMSVLSVVSVLSLLSARS